MQLVENMSLNYSYQVEELQRKPPIFPVHGGNMHCVIYLTYFFSVNSSQKNFPNYSQVKYLVIKYMTIISWWIIPCFQCNRKNNKAKTLTWSLCVIQNTVAYEAWVCSVTHSSAYLSWFYSYLKWRDSMVLFCWCIRRCLDTQNNFHSV